MDKPVSPTPTDPIAEAREALESYDLTSEQLDAATYPDDKVYMRSMLDNHAAHDVDYLRTTIAAYDREHTARVAAEGERDDWHKDLSACGDVRHASVRRQIRGVFVRADDIATTLGTDIDAFLSTPIVMEAIESAEAERAQAIRERDEARAELATLRARVAEATAAGMEHERGLIVADLKATGKALKELAPTAAFSLIGAAKRYEQRKHHENSK